MVTQATRSLLAFWTESAFGPRPVTAERAASPRRRAGRPDTRADRATGSMERFASMPDQQHRSFTLDPAAYRILRLSARRRRAELRRQGGALWPIRAALVAPARAAREALQGVRRFGRTVAAEGISPARQFVALWWLNLRHGYDTETAYRFRLFTWDTVVPAPRHIPIETAALLYRAVLARTDTAAGAILADKRRFEAWCTEHGFRTPRVLVEFEAGRVSGGALAPAEEPASDLFAKWGTQYGGDATQRWLYDAGTFHDDEGGRWTFAEIVEYLRKRSTGGVVVLQPRLVNHPQLRELSPNALSTIRVMTTRRPGGRPEFLAAVFRMGTGRSTADNYAQGGIACAVEASTGTLGTARRVDDEHRTILFERHPDTNAPIAGAKLPFWDEAVQLALDAHEQLGAVPCIGWDVALLPEGPALLEGNWNPCTKLLQVATQTPLLATDFASVYGEWLDQPSCRFDDDWLVDQRTWTPLVADASTASA